MDQSFNELNRAIDRRIERETQFIREIQTGLNDIIQELQSCHTDMLNVATPADHSKLNRRINKNRNMLERITDLLPTTNRTPTDNWWERDTVQHDPYDVNDMQHAKYFDTKHAYAEDVPVAIPIDDYFTEAQGATVNKTRDGNYKVGGRKTRRR
jgi:hypothetical protein